MWHTNNTAVKAGNYNILFCGNLTTTVRESLQLLWSNLGTINTDAETGTSSPAYQAFFKDNDYTSFVEQMLTNITNGASLQKAGQNSAEAPTLACLTGPGIATEETSAGERDLYEICSGNSKYAAFYRSSTNWIFLCPAFFSYEQQTITTSSPASQYCPNVVDNYFVQEYWMNLVQSQMYLLMHEILHFYLDSAPYPSHDSSHEVTDINVAFNVAAGDAISNPESYVIYAAMVSGGCTNYPASTDNDPDECNGTCLSKLGSPASDVISISNLTAYGMDVDAMSINAINKTISGLSTSSLTSSDSNESA
ncbi:hypothetical protein OEA41_009708 [Lepraria neglecta]|uniref:Lysine-specific metallo-endopeptidase domain-containing protein n=1 Tax=Lepraria neglecta TaxID=209136 RepID=A0AAE0DHX9_9LECA|nr:hypothetical protein OEA41_009708 [Lepraria neglecta]